MKKKYFGLLFWLYIFTLLVMSAYPVSILDETVGIGMLKFKLDKWVHFGAYFGLAFFYIIWQLNALITRQLRFILSTLTISIFISFSTEIVQLFIPSRSFSFEDFTANVVGILIAFSLFIVFRGKLKKTRFCEIKPCTNPNVPLTS